MTALQLTYLTAWMLAGAMLALAWYAYGWPAALLVAAGGAFVLVACVVDAAMTAHSS